MVGLGNKELGNAPVIDARVWSRVADRDIRPCAPIRRNDMHAKSGRVCRWGHSAKEFRDDGILRLCVPGLRLPAFVGANAEVSRLRLFHINLAPIISSINDNNHQFSHHNFFILSIDMYKLDI